MGVAVDVAADMIDAGCIGKYFGTGNISAVSAASKGNNGC
jgi:hypothetical protein